jgi:hypothetical protein
LEPAITVALITAASTIAASVSWIVRPRLDRRNGKGLSHDSYLEDDRSAALMLKHDIDGLKNLQQGQVLAMNTQSLLLGDIKNALLNMDKYGVYQRQRE